MTRNGTHERVALLNDLGIDNRLHGVRFQKEKFEMFDIPLNQYVNGVIVYCFKVSRYVTQIISKTSMLSVKQILYLITMLFV